MGRAYYHTCLAGKTEMVTPSDGGKPYEVTYGACGDRNYRFTPLLLSITCPDCAKVTGKKRLAEFAAQGIKIEAIAYTKPELKAEFGAYPRVKSVYRILYNGDDIGRVGVDTGWGKQWWMKPAEPSDEELANKSRLPTIRDFSARDLALSFIPELIGQGKMFDGPGLAALRQRRAGEAAARQEQRRQEQQRLKLELEETDARNRETYDGLISIQQKAQAHQISLTNAEAYALAEAIDAIKKLLPA
jgi:hypothetical protein